MEVAFNGPSNYHFTVWDLPIWDNVDKLHCFLPAIKRERKQSLRAATNFLLQARPEGREVDGWGGLSVWCLEMGYVVPHGQHSGIRVIFVNQNKWAQPSSLSRCQRPPSQAGMPTVEAETIWIAVRKSRWCWVWTTGQLAGLSTGALCMLEPSSPVHSSCLAWQYPRGYNNNEGMDWAGHLVGW